ncbi:MAG: prepilin peptidase [Spirochaetaceae bacterium]|nr:MAG: prepilin peptidase [Spirochaetaceae bacterium]
MLHFLHTWFYYLFRSDGNPKSSSWLKNPFPLLKNKKSVIMLPGIQSIDWIDIIILMSFLIPMGIIDFRSRKIPDIILFPGIAILFIRASIFKIEAVPLMLMAGSIAFAFLWLFYRFSQGKLGFGDVKLSFFIGASTGIIEWWIVLFIASLLAMGITLALVIAKKQGFKDAIPFAPFLFAGVAAVVALKCVILPFPTIQ